MAISLGVTLRFLPLIGIILLKHNGGCKSEETSGPKVKTSIGIIQGELAATSIGSVYHSYQGIPYAKPPIGDLRFRSPEPFGNWSGILHATSPGSACPQIDLLTKEYVGSEDCLYLNVYVPVCESSKSLPVTVWIHGGDFKSGDGGPDVYGPDNFMEQNMILVTMNYRLGPLGFLALGTPDIPGNAGLKDQNLALKWIRKHIHCFGGNPDQISVMGQGTGSVSIELHILSPCSKGLFSRAVLQSGSAAGPWSLQKHPENVTNNFVSMMGMPVGSDVEEFLRNLTAREMILGVSRIQTIHRVRLQFAPVIEKVFPNTKPFLTADPSKIYRSGHVNNVTVAIGFNTNNGLVFTLPNCADTGDLEAILNNCVPTLTTFIPDKLAKKCDAAGIEAVLQKLLERYFPATTTSMVGLTNLYSDYGFRTNIMHTAKKLAKTNKVYFATYDYSGSNDFLKLISNSTYEGAGHGDELGYMFNPSLPALKGKCSARDDLNKLRIMYLIFNFVKYGNPTPKISPLIGTLWKPMNGSTISGISIGEKIKLIYEPYEDVYRFWKDLMKTCDRIKIKHSTKCFEENSSSTDGQTSDIECKDFCETAVSKIKAVFDDKSLFHGHPNGHESSCKCGQCMLHFFYMNITC